MVRRAGLEPARFSPSDFKSDASTNFATGAYQLIFVCFVFAIVNFAGAVTFPALYGPVAAASIATTIVA
jgi:hypothetical protein